MRSLQLRIHLNYEFWKFAVDYRRIESENVSWSICCFADRSASRERTFPEESIMLQLHDGQCGLCSHFGEKHPRDSKLVEIRTSHKAPETLIDDCAHPKHASLHLKV